jgi:hypothetical protein
MNPDLAGRNPMHQITGKMHLMSPPVDLSVSRRITEQESVERDPRTFFVDTRESDIPLLDQALQLLSSRGEKYKLITIGEIGRTDVPHRTLSEENEEEHVRALHESAVMISARRAAATDLHAIRALRLGCWPVFPNSGVYPELLPDSLHHVCLYNQSVPERLATQLQNVFWIEHPAGYQRELERMLGRYDAVAACAAIDDRLEQLVISQSLKQ